MVLGSVVLAATVADPPTFGATSGDVAERANSSVRPVAGLRRLGWSAGGNPGPQRAT